MDRTKKSQQTANVQESPVIEPQVTEQVSEIATETPAIEPVTQETEIEPVKEQFFTSSEIAKKLEVSATDVSWVLQKLEFIERPNRKFKFTEKGLKVGRINETETGFVWNESVIETVKQYLDSLPKYTEKREIPFEDLLSVFTDLATIANANPENGEFKANIRLPGASELTADSFATMIYQTLKVFSQTATVGCRPIKNGFTVAFKCGVRRENIEQVSQIIQWSELVKDRIKIDSEMSVIDRDHEQMVKEETQNETEQVA